MTEARQDGCCETPMAEHVARFWKLLADGKVRILVETYHEGCGGHGNSSNFPDDVAKAIATEIDRLRGENRRLHDTKRWNIKEDFGDLLVCTGAHDKGAECEFHRYRFIE